jgi:hypothetical protein
VLCILECVVIAVKDVLLLLITVPILVYHILSIEKTKPCTFTYSNFSKIMNLANRILSIVVIKLL